MARNINALFVEMLVALCGAAAPVPFTDDARATPATTLQRAAAHLDRSSSALDRLVSVVRNGTTTEVEGALKEYTREFSQFHVAMAKLRIGKQELGFATHLVKEIESQISRVESVRPSLQPAHAVAFGEAESHLKSALQTITQNLNSKSRGRLLKLWGAKWPVPLTGPQRQELQP